MTRHYPDHIETVHLHAREASAAGRLRSSRLVGSDLSTWHRLKPTVPYTVVLKIRNSQSEVL
jgi:hypothetical protein